MPSEAVPEHHWLERLVGEWAFQAACDMGPDRPPETFDGTERVRSLGGLWTVAEAEAELPGGGNGTMITTLGFDPRRRRFVGTFLGSMMMHLWIYDGALDAAGTTLTLDTEGPTFNGGDDLARYQDIIAFRDDDHRILVSRVLRPDGAWHEIVRGEYRRVG